MTDEDLTPWEMKFNKALQDFNVKKITEAEFLAIGEEVLKVTDGMPIVQTARAEMPYDTYAALRRWADEHPEERAKPLEEVHDDFLRNVGGCTDNLRTQESAAISTAVMPGAHGSPKDSAFIGCDYGEDSSTPAVPRTRPK